MKTQLLIHFLIFCSIIICVKSQTYNLTVIQEPYVALSGGQTLVKGTWDDPAFEAPVGFTFPFFNDSANTLYSLDFFAGGFFSTNMDLTAANLIIAFNSDLIDRGYEIDSALSPILYKIAGSPGQRVFTLEFRNAGFWSGETNNGIYTDFINIQLRIREENGDIEVHIGPYSIQNPELDFEGFPGPVIGLVEGFDFENDTVHGEIFLIAGSPSNPDIITDLTPAYLIWPIPENTVYIFSRNTTKTKEIGSVNLKTYYFPSPTSDKVTLLPGIAEKIISPVSIINSSGTVVLKDYDTNIIEFESLAAGLYVLYFQTSAGIVTQKILLTR